MKRIVVGSLQTNCYIVDNEKKEAFIVDPGANGKKIDKYLTDNELSLKAILLTHGHFDHIGAVEYLYNKYQCPVYAHKETIELSKDSHLNLSIMEGEYSLNVPIIEADQYFNIIGFDIEWMFLPGHCQGSSMIRMINENIIFSGDVLFQGSIGRFDFPTSSHYDTKQSLSKIKSLDYNALILPGHGESTTLQQEKQFNPYLK